MILKKGKRSLESSKNRVGYTFILPWLIGIILFFIFPLISSIWYGFNEVNISPGSIDTTFIGIKNYKYLFKSDPDYVNNLRDSIGMMFYSLPIIISVSLIFAVLLNQNFKGRTAVRAIFFIPVLLANSAVMNQLNSEYVSMPLFSSGESGVGIIDYAGIINKINIPAELSPFLVFLLSNTTELIWKCGVPTILFLAGLQSISPSFYEVSKIEGANKWEEFWFITVPCLRNIISLVLIYTMIELFVDMSNKVVASSYAKMVGQFFGESSAMLWVYFLVVIVIMAVVLAIYQRFCIKRWE